MRAPAEGRYAAVRRGNGGRDGAICRPCCEDEAGGDTGSRAGRHAAASRPGGGPAAHDVLSLPEYASPSPQGAAVRAFATDFHEGRAACRSLAPLPILRPSSARCAFRGEWRQGGRGACRTAFPAASFQPLARRDGGRKCRSQENSWPGGIGWQAWPFGSFRRAQPRARGRYPGAGRAGRAPAPGSPTSGAASGRSDSAACRTPAAGEKAAGRAAGPAGPAAARRDTGPTPSARDRPRPP